MTSGASHSGRQILKQAISDWSSPTLQRRDATGYLLVVGIDRASLLNEVFGAEFMDALIVKVAKRLTQSFKDSIPVARIDGDVFGLFYADAPHSEMATVGQHLVHSFLTVPMTTDMGPIVVSISIGGVLMSQNSNPADSMTHAEAALRVAKDRGRGRFVSYNEAAEEIQGYRKLLDKGQAFMQALKENRLKLAFQPVINSKTNDVAFHETLIRFVDEDAKIHSAEQFIPAIEKLGLTRIVDRYVFRLVVRELDQYPDLRLSVNVSNQTLTDQDWLRGVVAALRDRPQVASRLIFEITETVAMSNMNRAQKVVRTLRDIGCSVALDDFGAGYTAFSQIKTLDINFVKIDKLFIRNLGERESQLFIRTLRDLATGLGIQTVGEGAETMAEARLLAGDGIDFIQGYVYGFPTTERVWLPKDHHQRQFDHTLHDDDVMTFYPQIADERFISMARH